MESRTHTSAVQPHQQDRAAAASAQAHGHGRKAHTTADSPRTRLSAGLRGSASTRACPAPAAEAMGPAREHGNDQLQFFVKTKAGKTLTFRLGRDCTTEELRNHVRVRTGRPDEDTWLAFGGKQLQDALTLADYGVRTGPRCNNWDGYEEE